MFVGDKGLPVIQGKIQNRTIIELVQKDGKWVVTRDNDYPQDNVLYGVTLKTETIIWLFSRVKLMALGYLSDATYEVDDDFKHLPLANRKIECLVLEKTGQSSGKTSDLRKESETYSVKRNNQIR